MNPDYKITIIDNEYTLKIIEPRLNLNVCKFDFLKIVLELFKHIFVEYHLEVHDNDHASLYILFKHFFEDFGYSQKRVYLDIKCDRGESVVYTVTPIQSDLPLTKIVGVFTLTDVLTIEISTTIEDVPDFIENVIKLFIEKMLFTLKQYIDNLK